jgi:hypothetical protein
MTPGEPVPEQDQPTDLATADLLIALDAVRRHADDRWVEVSDRVLAAALTATRRSHPVRAQAPGGPVAVSEQVLIAYLRAALDDAVPGTAVRRISVTTTTDDAVDLVLVELVARFELPLIPAADTLRDTTVEVLHELLGPVVPAVDVHLVHVHVGDVTPGDPNT